MPDMNDYHAFKSTSGGSGGSSGGSSGGGGGKGFPCKADLNIIEDAFSYGSASFFISGEIKKSCGIAFKSL